MRLKVTCTAEHIANGKRKEGSLCPIALAVKDAAVEQLHAPRDGVSVEVDGDIALCLNVTDFDLSLEKDKDFVNEFITLFDAGNAVEPFEREFNFEEREYEPPYDYDYDF